MKTKNPKTTKLFIHLPDYLQNELMRQYYKHDCKGLCLRQITPHDPCPQCAQHIDALITQLISQCNAQIDDLDSIQLWRELNCPADLTDISYSEFYSLIT